MKDYVVFKTYNNKTLWQAVKDRAVELGYKGEGVLSSNTVSLSTRDGDILCTYGAYEKNFVENYDDHEEGDLTKLFNSDYYAFKKPIQIGDYKVEFQTNRIKVGCQYVTLETIKEIAEHYFCVTEKE